jgi:hypothetical protein
MAAGILPLTVEQGATFRKSMVWKINGSPVNLTGYTARLQARANQSYDPMLSLTSSAGGGITLSAVDGRITIMISADLTSGLHAGKHKYDLELVSAGGDVTRLVKGMFIVSEGITENE